MEERLQIGVKHLHTKLLLVVSLLVGTSRENVGCTPFYSKYFILFQLDWNSCRSNSKTAQKEGILMPDKICNKDVPLHSLDIKISIPPSLVSDQLENTAQEEKVDKWNDSILPDLMNPIDTISNTSDSVINDRSAESIDDSGRFSLFHGSPYKEGLKKHISDYIKSKNAIKNSYMSTPNAN